MLKKILSKDTCAKCRICCIFNEDDVWEAPYGIKLTEKQSDGLFHCSHLGKNGCMLSDEKPFECKIWPFRVMDYDGKLVIALSSICPSLYHRPINELSDFLKEENLGDIIFKEARKNPGIIKPYENGYPIFLVEK